MSESPPLEDPEFIAARIAEAALSYWASNNFRTVTIAWMDEGYPAQEVEEFLYHYKELIESTTDHLPMFAEDYVRGALEELSGK